MVVAEVVSGEMGQRWKGKYAAVRRVRVMRDGTGSIDLMFDYHQLKPREYHIPYSSPLLGVVHIHLICDALSR
jgi:hypothetical protein